MADFVAGISLIDVVGLFLLLASIWLIKIILRRENENIFRGMVIFLLFLAVFLYLSQSSSSKWTITDLRDRFFPTEQIRISYRVENGISNQMEYTKYIFRSPLPPVSLSMDGSGDHFRINDIRPINRVLRHLDLPEVKEGVLEQAALTGSRLDAHIYRWNDYPPGTLIMEEMLIQKRDSLGTYHGIVQFTIRKRY